MKFEVVGDEEAVTLFYPFTTEDGPTRADIAKIQEYGVFMVRLPRALRAIADILMEGGTMVEIRATSEATDEEVEGMRLRILNAIPTIYGHADESPLDPATLAQLDAEEGTAEDLAQALRETCTEPPIVDGAELRAGGLLLRAFDANSRRVLLKLLAFAEAWTRRGGDRV